MRNSLSRRAFLAVAASSCVPNIVESAEERVIPKQLAEVQKRAYVALDYMRPGNLEVGVGCSGTILDVDSEKKRRVDPCTTYIATCRHSLQSMIEYNGIHDDFTLQLRQKCGSHRPIQILPHENENGPDARVVAVQTAMLDHKPQGIPLSTIEEDDMVGKTVYLIEPEHLRDTFEYVVDDRGNYRKSNAEPSTIKPTYVERIERNYWWRSNREKFRADEIVLQHTLPPGISGSGVLYWDEKKQQAELFGVSSNTWIYNRRLSGFVPKDQEDSGICPAKYIREVLQQHKIIW